MKSWKKNLIFTIILLVVAAGLFLWQRSTAVTGPRAELSYGKDKSVILSLSKDGFHDISTGKYTVHLEVKEGRIRFVDSPCPDHLCEAFGWLQNENDWAACLPAEAILTVIGEE